MSIEFPFMKLDTLQVAFGQIPNMREVIKACPEEFKTHSNPWCKLASYIFFHGVDFDMTIVAETQEENSVVVGYVQAWLGSFEPKHEQKEAVVGWLLSLRVKELPKFGGAK